MGTKVRDGLYKMNFHTVHGTGTGMIYASTGKLRGGNSAFAFIGSYAVKDGKVTARIATTRYNEDPRFQPLFGTDQVTLALTADAGDGDVIDFDGNALQMPGIQFKALLTRLSD